MSAPSPSAVAAALLLLLGAAPPLVAQESAAVGALFRDHTPLVLRIEADFDQLKDDRDEDSEERDGRLIIVAPDGSEAAYPLEVRTRGRFRLESNTCQFPPLRLDVPRSQMDGTPFENQDKLKLVTHCRDSDRYEQNTIKEYLVYRIYNLYTDLSFQARLARITYVDTSGDEEPLERWGFLIEAEEALAERLGAEIVEETEQGIHPARVANDHAGRLSLFQYMVGNTDFSIYGQHNVVGFDPPEGLTIPIPYDFDWTGLVNAPYARPDPSLGTRRVRQRVFRGLCRPGMDYPGLYALYLSKRDEVTALIQGEAALGEDEREDVLEFLDEFWEIVEDPGKAEREIERSCRAV